MVTYFPFTALEIYLAFPVVRNSLNTFPEHFEILTTRNCTVQTSLRSWSTMELNQKLAKAHSEDTHYGAFTQRKNTYPRNWR